MDEEIRRHIISLYYQYTSVREIARVTGITVKQVTRIVRPSWTNGHRKQGRSARPVAIPAKNTELAR
ncbi:TPA: helix-turn-helix domain-containing protein [Klebsiella variicola]|nr:helix-turn-helix domain-containing protein [Klebsiella variicola]